VSLKLPYDDKSPEEIADLVRTRFKVSKKQEKRGASAAQQEAECLEENPLRERRPDLDKVQSGCHPALIDRMEKWWSDKPDERPFFPDIVEFLNGLAVTTLSDEDLNRFKLIPDDQMKIPILTWIRNYIVQNGQCGCRGLSARNAVVTSVLKIQNGTLLEKYNLAKKIMKTQLATHGSSVDKLVNKTKQPDETRFPALDQEINELFLFHGTDTGETGRTIVKQGFDERVASLGGLYGAGSYFADCSCKSTQYTGSATSRTFLICRVLMGWPFCTNTLHNDPVRPERSARRPPQNTTGSLYDSIFAQTGVANHGPQVHNEYSVFKGDQVYPEFLVTFTVY
jgi:hypothetical protein